MWATTPLFDFFVGLLPHFFCTSQCFRVTDEREERAQKERKVDREKRITFFMKVSMGKPRRAIVDFKTNNAHNKQKIILIGFK